ncbi:hypothetical protein AMS68_006507 [Peltaster fructicola]|uniref:AB hydrolase-1 domain-containing protein n=1 Tax=Peltaster fructicola TaxID=286661 RepID=A0A6H0Y2W9_9PEZI|nr:hypothetical protein AMS68_006507 [Peltaster fructicola]
MKSTVLLSLASVAIASPAGHWGWDMHSSLSSATATAPAPPAYTSGIAPNNAPSSAGLKNATVGVSRGGKAVCVDGYISVFAQTTKNVKFDFAVPANISVVTDTFLKFVTSGSPFLKDINKGQQTVGGTYDIRATFCTPKDNLKPTAVQLLTHGIGFDRSYWDFAAGYSYVDAAAAHGYASLFYDRLGVGQSAQADPIQVIQAPLEVEIAHTIATMLRNGSISNNKFNEIVGVGHSFGSIISSAVTGLYPSAFDAAILTGFSANSSAIGVFTTGNNFDIAAQNNPARFGKLNNAYLVGNSIISTQTGFFRLPEFDATVLKTADATKQTVTFGEFFTQGAVGGAAPGFKGPVAVVNGDADLPFCFGNCSYPTNLAAAVKSAYPNAVAFDSYLAPSTGHGLNLHYTAEAAYEFIQRFLGHNGL